MNPSTRRLQPAASGLSLSRRPGAAEGPGWAWWLVLAAAAVYLAPYPAATLDPQGAQALHAAWRVASGQALPLQGPAFGDGWRLGPLWAYLLAPVVAAGASLTVAGVVLGALAAGKLVLAYLCGRRLVDWRLGLVWAVLLIVPGWASLEQMRLAPANIGATAVLAWLYCAVRTQQTPAPRWLASTALLAALGAHVHISLLVLTPLTLGIALQYLYRARAAGLAATGVAAVAWLLPWTTTLMVGGEAQAAGAGAPMLDPGSLVVVPELIWRVLAGGTWMAAEYLLPAWAGGGLWLALAATAGLLSLAGLLPALIDFPRTLGIMAGLALALAAAVALAGPPVGAQGVLALNALLSGLLALGLRAWLAAYNPWSRGVVALAIAALLAGGVCVSAAAIDRAHNAGEILLPGGGETAMGDGGEPEPRAVAMFPLWAHDLLGARLCAAEVPTVLHGDLASVTARSQAIGVRMRCGRRAELHIGGSGPGGVARHIAGFPRASWQALDRVASAELAGFVLTKRVRSVHPRRGRAILDERWATGAAGATDAALKVAREVPPEVTPEVTPGESPKMTKGISLTAGRASWVVVSELSPAGAPVGVAEVMADRRVVDIERRSTYSRFYRCRVCAGSLVRWQLNLRSRVADTIEVLALPAAGRDGSE